MCEPTTSEDIPKPISSLASAGGLSPFGSPVGQMTDLFGQEVAPANPTASLKSLMAERKATAMKETFGRISSPSSESDRLTLSLASKLQDQFSGDGGTGRRWTLRVFHTPVRRLFFGLTPVGPRTKESGSIGWPTPAARDGKDISRSNAFLSQRRRHSPSMATRWLELGRRWQDITTVYCLAMGYPSQWNDARPKDTATRLCRRRQQDSFEPQR